MSERQQGQNQELGHLIETKEDGVLKTFFSEDQMTYFPLSEEEKELMSAIENKDEKMVAVLLNKGVDVNVQDEEGQTPLMKAVQSENSEMIKHLLLKGARLDLKNKEGETALTIAFQSSNKGIFDLLIDYDLMKKGLANRDVLAIKIETQHLVKKESYGRDYTF